MSDTTRERFFKSVRKGKSGCWLWTAGKLKTGYGAIWDSAKKKVVRVHRFSYQLHSGKDPGEKMVCHECDNPLCVNPKHLWLGAARDNTEDKVQKGRSSRGAKVRSRVNSTTHMKRGEKHHNSKLTGGEVRAIRALWEAGGVTQRSISQKLGVSQPLVSNILRGKIWGHIL